MNVLQTFVRFKTRPSNRRCSMPSLDFCFFSASVPTENAKGMRTPARSGFQASLPEGKPSFSCSLDLTVFWLVSRSCFASSLRRGWRCTRFMTHGVEKRIIQSCHSCLVFLPIFCSKNEWQTTLNNGEANCPDYFQWYWIYCHSCTRSNRMERPLVDFVMSDCAHVFTHPNPGGECRFNNPNL